jgi:hypothetical protein
MPDRSMRLRFPAHADTEQQRPALASRGGDLAEWLPALRRGRPMPAPPKRWTLLVFEDETLSAIAPVGAAAVTLGRDRDCTVQLRDHTVSRQHCIFSIDGNEVVVQNLSSTNGTFRGGQPLRRHRLQDGDEIFLGRTLVKLVDAGVADWTPGASAFDRLYRDVPSGLLNRRGFWLYAESRAAIAGSRSPRCLLLGRVDGPSTLTTEVGAMLRASLPGDAVAGWIGRDEFVLFAAGTPSFALSSLGRQLGARVREAASASVTVGGVFQHLSSEGELRSLYAAADHAYLRACAGGEGSCVIVQPR